MLIRFAKNLHGRGMRCFEDPPTPGTGTGGGGARTFTQDQLNAILAEERRKNDERFAKMEEQLKKATEAQESFDEALLEAAADAGIEVDDDGNITNDAGDEPDDEPDDDTDDADDDDPDGLHGIQVDGDTRKILRAFKKRSDRQIELLQKRLEEETQKRLESDQKRRIGDRDRILSDVLTKENVVDMYTGVQYFKEKLQWDEDEERWVYVNKDGVAMDPDKGIGDEMPDFLRKPLVNNGGSGSRTAGPSGPRAASQLIQLRERVGQLKTKAEQSKNETDILTWNQARRELDAAERQTNMPGGTSQKG